MNELVSIIVPIYNVEMYLSECLASIEAQTYHPLQVILVNDGSTDSSARIAANFVNHNIGWELHHRPNGGVSAALNTGMDAAKGEFVAFVDGDDTVEPAFIQTLLANLLTHNADISCCNLGSSPTLLDSRNFWKRILWTNAFVVSRVNKLYRRSFFSESGYHFPLVQVAEDLLHAIALFREDVIFFVSPWEGYHYRLNPNSLTHNHSLSDWLTILESWISLSSFFRSLYQDLQMSTYALDNCLDYYRQMRAAYPNAKKELRKEKRSIFNAIPWKGVDFNHFCRYLRFALFGR